MTETEADIYVGKVDGAKPISTDRSLEEARRGSHIGDMVDDDREKDRPANGNVTDPDPVGWDGPEDPSNPRNWTKSQKLRNIVLISLSVLYS